MTDSFTEWTECYCIFIVFHSDPLAQYDDVQSNALLIPALRFCGQLASWTGNSPSNQVENWFYTVDWFENKFQTVTKNKIQSVYKSVQLCWA